MRSEDISQGTKWPGEAVCFRKSGSMEPPPRSVQAIAGAFAVGEHLVSFAFACEIRASDETAAAPSVEAFTSGISRALRGILQALAKN
jgi:hypothetical protein